MSYTRQGLFQGIWFRFLYKKMLFRWTRRNQIPQEKVPDLAGRNLLTSSQRPTLHSGQLGCLHIEMLVGFSSVQYWSSISSCVTESQHLTLRTIWPVPHVTEHGPHRLVCHFILREKWQIYRWSKFTDNFRHATHSTMLSPTIYLVLWIGIWLATFLASVLRSTGCGNGDVGYASS